MAPICLEHERFGRQQRPTSFRVHLGPGVTRDGEARLWLDLAYLDAVQIQRITPEPDRVEAGADRLVYVFRLVEPGRPTAVTFDYQPQQIGPLAGRLGLDGGDPLAFGQFIYP